MQFYRVSHQTVMSGVVVRYRTLPESPRGFEISASRDGVIIHGASPTMSPADVSDVELVLRRADEMACLIRNNYTVTKSLVSSDIDAIGLDKEPECVCELRESVFGGDDKILATRVISAE